MHLNKSVSLRKQSKKYDCYEILITVKDISCVCCLNRVMDVRV